MALHSTHDLRSIYRAPRQGPLDKVIHRLDPHCVDFLARSAFFVLSSADGQGRCDGSPKGGPPGFVEALDETRLAWADYSGNNRLDSFENVVDNDRVALLFLIPGLDETLRVNGRAELSTDEDLCRRFAVDGVPARVVVVVTVEEAYVHCAKALRRAQLWSPEAWPAEEELPSAAAMFKDHIGLEADVEQIATAGERNVVETLWQLGGGLG